MSLSPSERIAIISGASAALAVEEWSTIDLTLEEFGLPTKESWSGSSKSYIIKMMQGASDLQLSGLAAHLSLPGSPKGPSTVDPGCWQGGRYRLFISHISKERQYAAKLQTALAARGVSAFVAHKDIEPSAEWQVQIELALASCDGLIALLHDGFDKSKWTDQEVGYVMGRGAFVFSVSLGQVPYGFIGRFQAVPGASRPIVEVADEILRVLKTNKQSAPAIAKALASHFADSDSYQAAKARFELLEDVTFWNDELVDIVTSASKKNSQIYDAWYLPGKVESLLKKWS